MPRVLRPTEVDHGRRPRARWGSRLGRIAPAIAVVGLAALAACSRSPFGDEPVTTGSGSKLRKEDVVIGARQVDRGKDKTCCGYPLAENLGFALRFYWLALEDEHDDPDEIEYKDPDAVDIYTRTGFYLGSFSQDFIWHLRMEGSGILADGRVINYHGACKYGYGTCFQTLDVREYPFGRGARRRTLVPFKSVAVDPRLIPLGEPLYIPEFDGMRLPDGTIHDGCVRADDTGGGIKQRKMDFFVVSYGNFRFLLQELWQVNWVTPEVETPRCEYLRDL
jgi:3D (Asp-Asp-Asp) domain-containing protein